jgi:hypothetical protein
MKHEHSKRQQQNCPRTEQLRFHQLHQTALMVLLANGTYLSHSTKLAKKLLLSCSFCSAGSIGPVPKPALR